jgi:hypothetical protein
MVGLYDEPRDADTLLDLGVLDVLQLDPRDDGSISRYAQRRFCEFYGLLAQFQVVV